MDTSQVEKILRHTLTDFRISRGEKRVLKGMLAELRADVHDLNVMRSLAFDLARQEVPGGDSAAVLEWLEGVVKVLQPQPEPDHDRPRSEAYFSPVDACSARLVHLLNSVRRRLDICVFTITDNRIVDAIIAAHDRKVAVRIISDNDKSEDAGSDIDRLRRLGVPVRVDPTPNHMHHKFALIDAATLVTGSYNWTRSADLYNEENFIVIGDERLVKAFSREFERLWDAFA